MPGTNSHAFMLSSLQIDGHPFKSWYENHYGVTVGIKKGKKAPPKTDEDVSESAPAAHHWIVGYLRANRVANFCAGVEVNISQGLILSGD